MVNISVKSHSISYIQVKHGPHSRACLAVNSLLIQFQKLPLLHRSTNGGLFWPILKVFNNRQQRCRRGARARSRQDHHNTAARRRYCRRFLFCKIQVKLRSCRSNSLRCRWIGIRFGHQSWRQIKLAKCKICKFNLKRLSVVFSSI